MAEDVIHVRAGQEAVSAAIAAIPDGIMGGGGTGQLAQQMMERIGLAALSRIREAFIVKARGGTDEAGESWKPLAKSTVAYSRRNRKVAGDPKASRLYSRARNLPWIPRGNIRAGYAPSYALADNQREMWWDIYRQQLARFKGNKGAAAKVAWAEMKRRGATTLMAQYGNQKVDILRDTGLLLNSLSPGVQSAEQIFRVGYGEVIVGTNRKWAGVHHYGSRNGRIPQRRLWPEPAKWPSSWWFDITEQARAGLVDIATFLIKKGAA